MSIFDFFRKKHTDSESPPDIGREDFIDPNAPTPPPEDLGTGLGSDSSSTDEEPVETVSPRKKGKRVASRGEEYYTPVREDNFEMERIGAKLEALDSLLKGYSERFSNLSEQIGEVRAMTLNNEKEVAKVATESSRAVDIVQEVEPQKLRIENQKLDMRISSFEEKIELNKQYLDTIMTELKDLRRKAGVFVGTDALLKLNDEVKKDLIEIQKVNSKVRVNADKSEQIFIELKRGFAESQKMNEIISNLVAIFSGFQIDIGKLKIDYSNIATTNDLYVLKKNIEKRFILIESHHSMIESIKQDQDRLTQMIENILLMTKRNKDDISDIAFTMGNDHIKRVSDYDERLATILNVIDNLAGEIAELKQHTGKTNKIEKIEMDHKQVEKAIKKKKVDLKNIKIHPKISKKFDIKEPEVPEAVERIQENNDDELLDFDGASPEYNAEKPKSEDSKIYDVDKIRRD